mmetsp:Transcript_12541/g.14391  ORF Transcript_12541/g.14391 Transcript_12541/m.14391 type:complete len:103 (-) Transcript_12541:198-506(-)
MNDHVMAGDADVHGGNVYLSVLLATLGVKLPREPLLRDGLKGCIQFLNAQGDFVDHWLHELWKPENFDGGIQRTNTPKNYESRPITNTFCNSGRNAGEVALL